jgi:hypothetical protein
LARVSAILKPSFQKEGALQMMTLRAARVSRVAVAVTMFALLALLATLVVVPRVSGAEPRTVTFDDVITEDSQAQIPAPGHDATGFPARGDVLSGQGAVYATGDAGGTRIGTLYYSAVGTAEPENIESAANHLYSQFFLELWGQGSLAMTGTVNFLGTPTYLAVTGGTGQFAMTTGQCTLVAGDVDSWSCELQ